MSFFFSRQQAKKFGNIALLHQLQCKICPLYTLEANHNKDIKPHGATNPVVYILGTGPGEDEDRQGEFWIGNPGRMLKQKLSPLQLAGARFGNITRTRDPGDHPSLEVIECCRPSVENDIAQSKPKAIFGMGEMALQWATHSTESFPVTEWRGHHLPVKIKDHVCWFFPMYHPSYILQNGHLDHVFTLDLKNAYAFLARNIPPEVEEIKELYNGVNLLYSVDEILKAIEYFTKAAVTSVDLETNNIRPYSKDAKILSISLGTPEYAIAFPWGHPQSKWTIEDKGRLALALKKFFCGQNLKVAHNMAFELEWITVVFDCRAVLDGNWQDTMAAAYILGMGGRDKKGGSEDHASGLLSLDDLCLLNFGFFLKAQSKVDRLNLEREPLEWVLKYNCLDTKYDAKLYLSQQRDIDYAKLQPIFKEQNRRIPTLVLTQIQGLYYDAQAVLDFDTAITAKTNEIYSEILDHPSVIEYRTRYGQFNPGSTKDVAGLFKFLNFNTIREDRLGNVKISADEEILKAIDHPLARSFLELREYAGLKSKYIDLFTAGSIIYPDGKLHPVYTSLFTTTGRLSCRYPNCFPAEVEVLTDQGWKRWDTITDSCKLAQYDVETEEIEFVLPENLIKADFDGRLTAITSDKHLDILCTADHRFVFHNRDRLVWKTAAQFPRWYAIPQAGFYKKGTQSLRESQIILIAALQADAHLSPQWQYIDWEFTRPRKIQRLLAALQMENIPFNEHKPHQEQGKRFYISRKDVPSWLRDKKHYGPWVLDLDERSLQLLAQEIWQWGGGINENDFCTGVQSDADWVQVILTLTGRAATVRKRQSTNAIFVTARHLPYCSTANHTKTTLAYNGKIYCAQMPKGTLIVRHNGRAIVAGNCQNFPKKKHKEIRKILIAPPGFKFVSVDFGQIEFRVMAMVSKDKKLVEYIWDGHDVHADWAINIVKRVPKRVGGIETVNKWISEDIQKLKDKDKVFKLFRDVVKNNWVFAAFYGAAAKSLAGYMTIPEYDALELYNEFWQEFSGMNEWKIKTNRFYRENGYIETLTGRRRYAYMQGGEIINSPIQGLASDIVIDAMNRLSIEARKTAKWQYQAVLNIHDDLSFYLPDETWEEDLKHIVAIMLSCKYPFINVPLTVEASVGSNWYNLKEYGTFASNKMDQIMSA